MDLKLKFHSIKPSNKIKHFIKKLFIKNITIILFIF